MSKIYLPINNVSDYECYVVLDKDTIRAYNNTPRLNSSSNYDDFYVNSHYLIKNGSQTWGNYATLPTCISSSMITTDYVYRNDFSDICIILFFIIFIIYIPIRIISRIFGRWLKW